MNRPRSCGEIVEPKLTPEQPERLPLEHESKINNFFTTRRFYKLLLLHGVASNKERQLERQLEPYLKRREHWFEQRRAILQRAEEEKEMIAAKERKATGIPVLPWPFGQIEPAVWQGDGTAK